MQGRGFTLIELLITIVLMSVLLAIAVPQLRQYRQLQPVVASTTQLETLLTDAYSRARAGRERYQVQCAEEACLMTTVSRTGEMHKLLEMPYEGEVHLLRVTVGEAPADLPYTLTFTPPYGVIASEEPTVVDYTLGYVDRVSPQRTVRVHTASGLIESLITP